MVPTWYCADWSLSGHYLAATWSLPGLYMVHIWFLAGFYVGPDLLCRVTVQCSPYVIPALPGWSQQGSYLVLVTTWSLSSLN
jgi:hypothetical protein